MEKTYDIVIVGCGLAGAAAGLAALDEDMNVCIVERKERRYIGKKICGELMPLRTLTWLNREFGVHTDYFPLRGLEICTVSKHGILDSTRSTLRIEDPLCTVDRWQFGQALVKTLLDKGAEVYQGTAKGPVFKGYTRGIRTKDSHTFLGRVTIDCSGVSSVLSKCAAADFSALKSFGVAYKEDIVLNEALTQDYAVILLHKHVLPSGYVWLFPKSEHKINAGAGGLAAGKVYYKKILNEFITLQPFVIQERKNTGFGVLPLGRPLPSAVCPGLLLCGDAAFQVNPLTGEGMAPALRAGYAAGITAAEAVQNKDTSVKGMWKYNLEFARRYGMIHAPLVILKDFLFSLSSEELVHLMERIITSEDLAQVETGSTGPAWRRILTIVLENWKKFPLLFRSYSVVRKMNRIRTLYEKYPQTPEEFPLWNQKLTQCYD